MSDRWFAQHRQEWIAEAIKVYGFINRDHLERKFGISTPQASMDIKLFQQRNPGAIEYDPSSKKYARPCEMQGIRDLRAAYNRMLEDLQGICEEFGCLGGEHRLNWIRSELSRLRGIESAAPPPAPIPQQQNTTQEKT